MHPDNLIRLNKSFITGALTLTLALSQSFASVYAADDSQNTTDKQVPAASQAETKTSELNSAAKSSTETQASTSTPAATPKTKWKPGDELVVTTNTEDLVPTDDIDLAQKQVQAYPDSPEASFILAVALTRTSRVEEALKEVRRARKLAETKGGTAYFDKMIQSYEEMLKNYPNENRVRYGLAWAYYMKAYLLANYSRKVAAWNAANTPAQPGSSPAAVASTPKAPVADNKLDLSKIASALGMAGTNGSTPSVSTIPSVMDKVDPKDIPQIKKFYEMALQKLSDLLAQKPDDVWAQVYKAHLQAEYSGSLNEAMKTWSQCRDKYPNNPAAYFFLGEGYLKQGNLKESINNVSRAVALRAMGF